MHMHLVQRRKETTLAPIHWVWSVDSDERAATCELRTSRAPSRRRH